MFKIGVFLFLALGAHDMAFACSAFSFSGKNKVIVGKSYDWFFAHGFGAVFVNPKGIKRTALQVDSSPNPAQWTSRFGSVTLTQFGRGFPIGGMNESGLVVEMLQLEATKYNSQEVQKPFVNEAQWTQYQLDNFSSVQEIVDHLDDIRVVGAYTGIHYFASDVSGDTLTLDFVDGHAVVHRGGNLPIKALTNDSYDDLMSYDRSHSRPGFDVPATSRTSEVRFQVLAEQTAKVAETPDSELTSLAWNTLDQVRLNGFASDALLEPSQWNIVYDLTEKTISFRSRNSPQIKKLQLTDFDLSCKGRELTADVNLNVSGNVRPYFSAYAEEFNRELVNQNSWLIDKAKRDAGISHDPMPPSCDNLLK